MRRITLLFMILGFGAALPLAAQAPQQESLADMARQVRAEKDKNPKKTTKVFTNDNLPEPKPGETISSVGPEASGENPSTLAPTASNPGAPPPESPEDKGKAREALQDKLNAARQDLAKAKEQQQLCENELDLLKIQQAREYDPITQADMTAKVQAKQSQLDANKTAADAAQKSIDDLEKELKDTEAQ